MSQLPAPLTLMTFSRPAGNPDGAPTAQTLALFAPNSRALARCRRRLPLGATLISLANWTVFAAVAPSVDCAVVSVPARPTVGFLAALERLRAAAPLLPLVLVVRSASALAAVGHVGATLVVRDRGHDQALWNPVQYACTASLLQWLATAVRESPRLPAALKTALTLAVTRVPPARSIAELVAVTGQNRRTLWYNWKRQVGPTELRLEDLVDWLLMLRASLAHARGSTWSEAALELGIHRHTLARLVERHLGEHLPEFSPDTHARLRAIFLQKVVSPLLSRQQA